MGSTLPVVTSSYRHCHDHEGFLCHRKLPTDDEDDDDGDDDIVIAITSNITINIVVVVCSNCVDTHGSWNVSSPTQDRMETVMMWLCEN